MPGPEELTTPEGRQTMRTIIADLLATAEAGGARAEFLDRLRADLKTLDVE